MHRWTICLLAVVAAAVFALDSSSAYAKGKKKKDPNSFHGVIFSVSTDGKSITVATKGNKKKAGETTEIQVTDQTKIAYTGIDPSEQQLKAGYAVVGTTDPQAPTKALTIDVSPKKKKVKKPKSDNA